MIKKKIVVVDDFPGVRAIIKEALEKKGYVVLEASNGQEALKYFDGTQVDLLITDYDMPEMDGAKLVTKLRDTTRYMFTPVIMLTGVRKDRIEDKISKLNIACFLQKPFEIKHFYTVVERLV
jgi:two-component system, chemotaxis family, chemotaxis protein CheY